MNILNPNNLVGAALYLPQIFWLKQNSQSHQYLNIACDMLFTIVLRQKINQGRVVAQVCNQASHKMSCSSGFF